MGIAVISDIHLRKEECIENNFFKRFTGHPLVQNSETIIFLGDIFDLLFGSYPEYLIQYSFFFDFIFKLISKKKHIHYLEGNHDLHMKSLFIRFFNKHGLKHDTFRYHQGGFLHPFNHKNIYFSHGDEMDVTDKFYPYYRNFISSSFIRLLTENFLPHSFIEEIGHQASLKSRLRNQHKYSDKILDEVIRKKIRQRTEKAWDIIRFDLLVCGHTHIKDYYHSRRGFLYVNNGYASRENTFIHIDENGVTFPTV